MRTTSLGACLLLFTLLPLSPVGGQEPKAARRPTEPAAPAAAAADGLFLAAEDIPRVQRLLPGLVEASQKGGSESKTFFARQELNFQRMTQLLSNISVAYSAITFDEWLKEIQPLLGANPGEYQKLVEQARKQLEEITARHQKAQKGGRSALAVNKEFVVKNRAAVEEIIALLREVKVEFLPQSAAADSPPVNR
jgi:hypothetical protein